MGKNLLEIAADIVKSQASLNKMSAEDIETILARTYNVLYQMKKAEDEGRGFCNEEGERDPAQAMHDPHDSIQESDVVCLECGAQMRQLTANHLRTHGLTTREYKRKHGLPLRQPLCARSLTKLRSKSAKKRGLPPALKAFQDKRKQQRQSVPEDPSTDAAMPLTETNGSHASALQGKPSVRSQKTKEADASRKHRKNGIAAEA